MADNVIKLHEKALGHVKRLQGVVAQHREALGAIVEHASHQLESAAAGALFAYIDEKYGASGGVAEVGGFPASLAFGVAAGGLALAADAMGEKSWPGHLSAFAGGAEAVGTYVMTRSALQAHAAAKASQKQAA